MFDLDRFGNGDRAYLNELVREHSPLVTGIVSRYASDSDEQADLFQKAWVRALERRKSYRGEGPFRAWLRTLTVNVCRVNAREMAAFSALKDRSPKTIGAALRLLHWAAPAPDELVMWREDRERVAQCLELLEPREQEALRLRYLEGYTCREAAEVMGVKDSTVRSLVRNGLTRLERLRGGSEE